MKTKNKRNLINIILSIILLIASSYVYITKEYEIKYLTHNPIYFKTYASWGADLTLCGHLHGGIIRIPFYGGLFSPEKVFFPQYDTGLFKIDNHYMIVNRGLGIGNLGFRFSNNQKLD